MVLNSGPALPVYQETADKTIQCFFLSFIFYCVSDVVERHLGDEHCPCLCLHASAVWNDSAACQEV